MQGGAFPRHYFSLCAPVAACATVMSTANTCSCVLLLIIAGLLSDALQWDDIADSNRVALWVFFEDKPHAHKLWDSGLFLCSYSLDHAWQTCTCPCTCIGVRSTCVHATRTTHTTHIHAQHKHTLSQRAHIHARTHTVRTQEKMHSSSCNSRRRP